jgi:hypothetical protein
LPVTAGLSRSAGQYVLDCLAMMVKNLEKRLDFWALIWFNNYNIMEDKGKLPTKAAFASAFWQ